MAIQLVANGRSFSITSDGEGSDLHNKGTYATPEELALITGVVGDYAIVESTDTFWTYDEETRQFVNTQKVPSQADYAQTDPTAPDFIKNKPAAITVEKFYTGTEISGEVTNRTVNSSVPYFNLGDKYLNTETNELYECVFAGNGDDDAKFTKVAELASGSRGAAVTEMVLTESNTVSLPIADDTIYDVALNISGDLSTILLSCNTRSVTKTSNDNVLFIYNESQNNVTINVDGVICCTESQNQFIMYSGSCREIKYKVKHMGSWKAALLEVSNEMEIMF